MPSPDLFEEGLSFFNSGKYYEAHESWEDLWNLTSGPQKTFYQGLVQAAVALHHLERNNTLGARGVLTKSLSILTGFKDTEQSIDTADLIRQLQEIRDQMRFQAVRIARLK